MFKAQKLQKSKARKCSSMTCRF